jgi:hypothetical protein
MYGKLTFIVILFCAGTICSQEMGFGENKMRNKLRDLEKIKLIEALDMDEATSIRFFTRRNSFQEKQRSITFSRDSLYSALKSLLKDQNFQQTEKENILSKIFDYELSLLQNKREFIESLDDILSLQQKYNYVSFEHSFKKQIQRELKRRGRRNYSP